MGLFDKLTGTKRPADLVAEWRLLEPAWQTFFARTQVSRVFQTPSLARDGLGAESSPASCETGELLTPRPQPRPWLGLGSGLGPRTGGASKVSGGGGP